MSQSHRSQYFSLRRIAQAALLLMVAVSSSLMALEPEPGMIKILGPDGQSAEQERKEAKRFGPIKPSDTLWSLASKTRPDSSISVYQMMFALYQKNPHAFENGNIHRLGRGSILLIPSKEEALAFTDRQATQKLRADQLLIDQEKAKLSQLSTPQQTVATKAEKAPLASTEQTNTKNGEVPQQVQGDTEEALAAEKEEQERARKLREIEMRELKSQLADSRGSFESLTEQNRALLQRVENLSSTLEALEGELEKERAESNIAIQALESKANAAQQEVQNLIENPPTASLWLWILSGGLAVVFGLIGWLLLRNRKSSESAPAQQLPTVEEPVAEALSLGEEVVEPEADAGTAEEEVLLDLGLDDDVADEPIDLSIDDSDDDLPDMVDLDSLDLDEGSSAEEEEVEGLLARDADLSESEPVVQSDEPDLTSEMQEIQTLDLDLDAAGGELTQEALDALAGMDDFIDSEDESVEAETGDDLEEAFDAIGQSEPDAESALESAASLADEIDEAIDQTSQIEPEPSEEEIDIDALLAESAPAQEEIEEASAIDEASVEGEEEFDIDALLAESAPAQDEIEEASAIDETSAEGEEELDIDALLAESAPAQEEIEEALATEEASAIEEISTEDESEFDALSELGTELDAVAEESEPEEGLQEELQASASEEELLLEESSEEALAEEGIEQLAEELDAVTVGAESLEDSEIEEEEVAAVESGDLDEEAFDLDTLLEENSEPAEISEQEVEDVAIDIDNLLAGDLPDEEQAPESAMSADELEQEFELENIAEELLASDDDLDLGDECESEIDESEAISADEIEAQLSDFAIDDTAVEAPLKQNEEAENAEEFVDIDQLLAEAEEAEPNMDDDLLAGELEGVADLEAEDEVAAKLDLARAYIEIGDQDVAKQLLQEIAENEEGKHKAEAIDLLEQL